MVPIKGEDKFQEWVQARIIGCGGHFQDHRFSAQNDVPDLSAAYKRHDYWLELKYGEFKLLHSRYDEFYFHTHTRGQLAWLQNRKRNGRAVCGVLGYFTVTGDGGTSQAYLFFMDVDEYLSKVWTKVNRMNAGAAVLGPWSAAAHSIKTGDDLFAFINSRAAAR